MSAEGRRGWRVGHQGRDRMFYEELRDGTWERIDVDGEMLTGRAHHVIYFASPERWQAYPEWARGRRAEIIARITSEFREPDYEYHGLDATAAPTPATPPSGATPLPPPIPPRKPADPPSANRTLLGVVVGLFLLAALMGWLVATGVARGETRLPLRQSTLRRPVPRATEPATFWLSIGVYATVGAGALALGVLGARAARRP
jgi:hypothetical protein